MANLPRAHYDAVGVLILGDDGRVIGSTPAGERWSGLLLDAEIACNHGVPSVVRSIVAALQNGDERAVEDLVVATPAGLVRVEASRGVNGDATAIVFSPNRAPAVPEIPGSWPLTPSEREVVNLLVSGRSDRQISDELFMSESTVRTHLRHVYDKLDVHSRTQLLARLFAEAYWAAPSASDRGEDGGETEVR